jgi:hypothetical protein
MLVYGFQGYVIFLEFINFNEVSYREICLDLALDCFFSFYKLGGEAF